MRENGIITKSISGKIVEVALQKNSACKECGLCHNMPEGMMGIEAVDEIGARVGQQVEIEIPSGEVVKGSLVVFLLPIFFLIIGYFLGFSVSRFEVIAVICSLVSLFFGFLVVRWYDQNVVQKEALRARIIKIN